jgi:hypothetical protein
MKRNADFQGFVETVITDVINGKKSITEAANTLLQEMGRGGRILSIDENLLGVEPFLAEMGYTTEVFRKKMPDDQIKPQLEGRVFITQNGKDFCNPEDMAQHYYGLIWVLSNPDDKTLATRIKNILMQANFHRNLAQIQKV